MSLSSETSSSSSMLTTSLFTQDVLTGARTIRNHTKSRGYTINVRWKFLLLISGFFEEVKGANVMKNSIFF